MEHFLRFIVNNIVIITCLIKIQAVLLIVVVTIMVASGNHDEATAGSDNEQQVIDPIMQSRQNNIGLNYFFHLLLMDS